MRYPDPGDGGGKGSPGASPSEQRAERLLALGAHLATSRTLDEIAAVVVQHGAPLIGARAAALVVTSVSGSQPLLASFGGSAVLVARVETALAGGFEVEDEPGTVILPLAFEQRRIGVLGFELGRDRTLGPEDFAVLHALASQCTQALDRARLADAEKGARLRAEIAEERAEFLAGASAVLGESLDYEETLRRIARMAVPQLADWCAVDLLDHGGLKRLAVAHVDPAKVELAHALQREYPTDLSRNHGVAQVLRTGVAELIPEIPDELLVASIPPGDTRLLQIVRELGLHSVMTVPIVARGKTLGAITFVAAESLRRFGPEDLRMAEDLGRRAGAAIDNARLYQEALDAVRIRDEFLSVAEHELRTPLTSALLQVQRATARGDVSGLDRAVRSIRRLAALIDRLLDASRLGSGRIEVQPSRTDIATVVREVIDRLGPARATSTVMLAVTEEVEGNWDPAALDQAFSALLDNALKYGEGKPVEVTIERHGEQAVIRFRDHGMGIAAADQERIFQRFERAVSVRNFGGFGLGLWIAREIVTAHHGTIAIESERGKGATLTVTLPIGEINGQRAGAA